MCSTCQLISTGADAKTSSMMNFKHADANDADQFNAILWRDRMGSRPVPAPKHTVIPDRPGKKDDDDD